MKSLRERRERKAAEDAQLAEPPEENPMILALQKSLQALLRRAAQLHALTETASEVDAFCGCLETVLLHKFKTKQFYMFTCHPWSLIEATEAWGELEASTIKLARGVGSSDAARLRA